MSCQGIAQSRKKKKKKKTVYCFRLFLPTAIGDPDVIPRLLRNARLQIRGEFVVFIRHGCRFDFGYSNLAFITMTTNDAASIAAAVCAKLPEFWKADIEMWYAQAEAQFVLENVTKDRNKFYRIGISKVNQSIICHVADLVSAPPQQEKKSPSKTG